MSVAEKLKAVAPKVPTVEEELKQRLLNERQISDALQKIIEVASAALARKEMTGFANLMNKDMAKVLSYRKS